MHKNNRLTITVVLALFIFLTGGLVFAEWQGEAILGSPPPPIRPEAPPAQQSSAGLEPRAYLPLALRAQSSQTWVNTQSKEDVRNFYLTEYLASEGVPHGWNGNHSSCDAGSTTAAFKQAILTRINYFRAMAGIPNLTALRHEYNVKAQEAALMMSVNNQLSHDPPPGWLCYTADGDEAAGNSNLYLGVFGPSAITGYMQDAGGGNYPVGHRRWLLYPHTQFMGSGDVPQAAGHPRSNALWVFDEHIGDPRPDTREEYVAWPPPGYTPYQVVFNRWSFGYGQSLPNFSNTTVTMTKNGQPLSLLQHPVVPGFGERTIVWEPNDIFGQAPANDVVYTVTINNVVINGQSRNFSYQVIIFAP